MSIRNPQRGPWIPPLALVALATAAACEPLSDDSVDAGATTAPRTVTVRFEGALVGPGKVDHTTWDESTSDIPQAAWDGLTQALAAANPYAAVVTLMAGPLLAPVAKPDPYGTVSVDGVGVASQIQDLVPMASAPQDSFVVVAPSPPGWTGVRLDKDIRFRVHLLDSDLVYDDEIGVATINTDDLKAALEERKIHHVNVAGQTNNQLLFVDVSVFEE